MRFSHSFWRHYQHPFNPRRPLTNLIFGTTWVDGEQRHNLHQLENCLFAFSKWVICFNARFSSLWCLNSRCCPQVSLSPPHIMQFPDCRLFFTSASPQCHTLHWHDTNATTPRCTILGTKHDSGSSGKQGEKTKVSPCVRDVQNVICPSSMTLRPALQK